MAPDESKPFSRPARVPGGPALASPFGRAEQAPRPAPRGVARDTAALPGAIRSDAASEGRGETSAAPSLAEPDGASPDAKVAHTARPAAIQPDAGGSVAGGSASGRSIPGERDAASPERAHRPAAARAEGAVSGKTRLTAAPSEPDASSPERLATRRPAKNAPAPRRAQALHSLRRVAAHLRAALRALGEGAAGLDLPARRMPAPIPVPARRDGPHAPPPPRRARRAEPAAQIPAAALLLLALILCLLAARPAPAAVLQGASGLPSPERVVGFEGATGGPGALVRGLARAGVLFSRPLTLSPQDVDHVAGMSGAALGSHGDIGWDGTLSIRFTEDQEAAAFAFAATGAWTAATALLDGEVVESARWFAGWSAADTAYIGFTGILFDEIRLETDAALILIDNLQWGEAAASHAAGGEAEQTGALTLTRAAAPPPGMALRRGDAAEPGATDARPRAAEEDPLGLGRPRAALSTALSVESGPAPIPLPAAFLLLSGALAGLGFLRMRS